MDTAIMAARVALLILVTGTFAVLWSEDRLDKMASIDRPVKVLVGSPTTLPPVFSTNNRSRHFLPQKQSDFRSPVASKPVARHALLSSNANRIAAPLPHGIAAGTYLVADQFGRTEIRVVSLHDGIRNVLTNGKVHGNVPADHYSVELGQTRWHYIRLNPTIHDRLPVRPTAYLIHGNAD